MRKWTKLFDYRREKKLINNERKRIETQWTCWFFCSELWCCAHNVAGKSHGRASTTRKVRLLLMISLLSQHDFVLRFNCLVFFLVCFRCWIVQSGDVYVSSKKQNNFTNSVFNVFFSFLFIAVHCHHQTKFVLVVYLFV